MKNVESIKLNDVRVLKEDVENFSVRFEKGDKVKIIGIGERGYDLMELSSGKTMVECGWDLFEESTDHTTSVNEIKFFKVTHDEGNVVIVAEFARQGLNYYLNEWMDDLQIDDLASSKSGFNFIELTDEELNEKRKIYNEDTGETKLTSYKEIAEDCIQIPCVIVTPNF